MGKIIAVVGARPNFMKMSPVIKALIFLGLKPIIVHTGQHYDEKMSQEILSDLDFEEPNYFLKAGGGTGTQQTSRIMKRFEKICKLENPILVIVAGDVNSTLACALVAVKMRIKIAHIESGLRSFDMEMPEEINRILTDRISDFLFTTEKSAESNLKKEGIDMKKVHFVGNCMIDSLVRFISPAKKLRYWQYLGYQGNDYILATVHRPSNVDTKIALMRVVSLLNQISKKIPILFPIHPRTKSNLEKFSLELNDSVELLEPLSYLKFLSLMSKASMILTDSGGIQEETTALGVPCITMRENTERPITTEIGTNVLAGTNNDKIIKILDRFLKGDVPIGKIPPLWDGKASIRTAEIVKNEIE